jgi:photosystem II stability/assembly factor-like uncharacterized protein
VYKKYNFLLLVYLLPSLVFAQLNWEHTDGPPGARASRIFANDNYAFIPEDDFLYRSADGMQWKKLEQPVTSYFAVYNDTLVNLRYDESAEQLFFQISPDNGDTWTIKEVPAQIRRFFDIGMCSHGIYWISWDKDLLYKSIDLGDTWEMDTLPITGGYKRLNIFDDKLYVDSDYHLWRSDTLGDNWEDISPPVPSGQYIGSVFVVDSHLLVSTEEYILDSHDHGQTWDTVSTSYAAISNKFARVGENIYANQYLQLLLTKDYGKNWDTLTNTQFYNLRNVAGFRDMLLVSTYDKGIFRLDTHENTFIESNEGLSKGVIYDLASGKDKIWAACGNGIFAYDVPANTWSNKMDLPLPEYGYKSVSANDEGWVYVAALQPAVFYFSKNEGQSWDTLYPPLVGNPWGIRVQIIDDILFVGLDSKVFRSDDEGQQWDELAVVANYRNPNVIFFKEKLYVSGLWELYVSSDLGVNWTALDLPFNTVEVSAFGDHLYAVTLKQDLSAEVHISKDGVEWTLANEGLEEYGYYGFELVGYQPAFFYRDTDHHYALLGWQGHFSTSTANTLWSPLPTSHTGYAYLVHDDMLYLGREGMYTTPIENPFVTAVEDISKDDGSTITLSPNPAYDFISLTFANKKIPAGNIEISSANGVIVKSFAIKDPHDPIRISVDDLPAGKYFVKVFGKDRCGVQSFVKTH